MKKTYITPEAEIVNIELESMIAASAILTKGGNAGSNGITESDINARTWFENTMDNDLLW